MPELEFRQPSNEWPEFVVLFCGQGRTLAIFYSFVLRQAGVELWLQEREEEVEEVDAQAVGHYIPALGDNDP